MENLCHRIHKFHLTFFYFLFDTLSARIKKDSSVYCLYNPKIYSTRWLKKGQIYWQLLMHFFLRPFGTFPISFDSQKIIEYWQRCVCFHGSTPTINIWFTVIFHLLLASQTFQSMSHAPCDIEWVRHDDSLSLTITSR